MKKMESKHTPGPWEIQGGIIVADLNYDAEREEYIGVSICQIHGTQTKAHKANARLIAAAPAMYSFVESVAAKGCEENGERGPDCGECDTCNARKLLTEIAP
jgi:hypothetical protein